MMQFQEAKRFLDTMGIPIIKNDMLKLYVIFLDESSVYLNPDDLAKLDLSSFKQFLANVLLQYQSSDPYIVYH